ncbi:hypothetical protein RMCBS344292_10249 [Rhizopus microsporus]|nr:hypothetical protein RMCBS344292_10249 [Rhizopus microsporus]
MSRLYSPSEWVAPFVSIASLALLPLGPIFFPRFYLLCLCIYFSVFLFTQYNHVCKFWLTSRKIKRTIRKWNKKLHDSVETLDSIEEQLQYYSDTFYFHAFIIPNYYEPEDLLKDTIERIAMHSQAHTHYALILAMEQSEPGWEAKASRLEAHFSNRFAQIIITGHPTNIPGESRGKGSNVAYAARHGCLELVNKGIDRKRVIITVTDSDAVIPELYIREVEDALNKTDDPYHLLCAPPIFFSRNCFDAKRHYNGVADVAYTLKNAFQASSISLLDRLKVCFIILEAHMVPATSGWLMFMAVPLMQAILFPPFAWMALVPATENPILISEFYGRLWSFVKLITLCLPLPLFGTLAVYEQLHRVIDREFFRKQESRAWFNLVDYVNLPIAAWLFMTLPSTLACIKRLLCCEEKYITSEKLFFKDDTPANKTSI